MITFKDYEKNTFSMLNSKCFTDIQVAFILMSFDHYLLLNMTTLKATITINLIKYLESVNLNILIHYSKISPNYTTNNLNACLCISLAVIKLFFLK